MAESECMDINEELRPALKSIGEALRDIRKSKRTVDFKPTWM